MATLKRTEEKVRFKIFDVGHGFFAYALARNGNVIVFDCGGDGRRPSQLLRQDGIVGLEYLFITNYDEDHISDLPTVYDRFPVSWLVRNTSVPPEALRRIKLEAGPISEAMEILLDMHGTYTETSATEPEMPGVSYRLYFNMYPDFKDTNNLSLATVLDLDSLRIMIPGDLEAPGWRALLEDEVFRLELSGVDVLIASHHGCDSGYCEEVFDYCSPDAIVLPESEAVGPSPEMRRRYEGHAGAKVYSTLGQDWWWDVP